MVLQSGILEEFSNKLPNSQFRNSEKTKKWSELIMNFFIKSTTQSFNALNEILSK